MDIGDVAAWVVFVLVCTAPALLTGCRVWVRVAVFPACVAMAVVLPALAVLAGVSGNMLDAVALLWPVPP